MAMGTSLQIGDGGARGVADLQVGCSLYLPFGKAERAETYFFTGKAK